MQLNRVYRGMPVRLVVENALARAESRRIKVDGKSSLDFNFYWNIFGIKIEPSS